MEYVRKLGRLFVENAGNLNEHKVYVEGVHVGLDHEVAEGPHHLFHPHTPPTSL